MLILTRRPGEQLRIGEDITVLVVGVMGGHVRLGTQAPRDVSVHREEIYRRIQRERWEPMPPPRPDRDTTPEPPLPDTTSIPVLIRRRRVAPT